MPKAFSNRRDAGRRLGAALGHLRNLDPIVLALPRGGVPVAYEIAGALEAPLAVLLVRKIGAPSNPELGIGVVVDAPTHRWSSTMRGSSACHCRQAISKKQLRTSSP